MPIEIALLLYVSLIIAMVFHEAAHAWVAKLGGDPTADEHGQVTLNPIPHMRREPFGTIVMPIIGLIALGFPIGFAHAPYNPHWADRYPKRAALMALAGPMSNFLLAAFMIVLMAIGLQLGYFEIPITRVVSPFAMLVGPDGARAGTEATIALILCGILFMNTLLCLFNLVPLPPLDGAAVLEGFLPGPAGNFFRMMRSNPQFAILGLIGVIVLINYIFWPIWSAIVRFVWGLSG